MSTRTVLGRAIDAVLARNLDRRRHAATAATVEGLENRYLLSIPAAPTGLQATASSVEGQEISLQWLDQSDNETGFRIEHSTTGAAGSWSTLASVGAGVTTYNDTGLAELTTYYYRVIAVNGPEESLPSNSDGATTRLHAPTDLAVSFFSASQVDVSWTDASSQETIYYLDLGEYTPGGLVLHMHVATAPANSTSTQVSWSFKPSTDYRFYLWTSNGGSNDRYATVDFTTPAFPLAPSGVSLTAVSDSQTNLSWTATSGNEDGFVIERSPTGSSGWTHVADVTGATSWSDTGLAELTSYSYRVKAYNGSGDSLWSSTAATRTLPIAPASLTGTSVSGSQINLSWTDSSAAEAAYHIQQRLGDGSWLPLGSVGANVTTYTVTGTFAPSTSYSFRVRAYNSTYALYSAYTTADVLTGSYPQAPADLSATATSDSQINLTWTDTSSDEQGFRIERSANGTSGWAEVASVAAGVTAWDDTGLAELTTCYYRVIAYSAAAGDSAPTAAASATTALIAPASLTAISVSATAITLNWTDSSSKETRYYIEQSSDGSTWGTPMSVGANLTTCTVSGSFAPATPYWFRIRAYCASPAVYSLYTGTSVVTAAYPQTPANLSAMAISDSQINIVWSNNSSNEQGFRIDRSATGSGGWTQVASVGAGVTTWTDTGLVELTPYYYRVRAYNAAGESLPSASTSATTLLRAPAALTVTVISGSSVILNWTDSTIKESRYYIEQSSDEIPWSALANVALNITSYNVMGTFASSTTYSFRVRAYNSTVNVYSPYTSTSVTTGAFPAAPANLSATAISGSEINLAWSDTSNNEESFRIERSPNGSSSWTLRESVGAGVTTWTDSGLYERTTYYYRVKAWNAAGESQPSAVASAATPWVGVSGLTATSISGTQINLSWTDSTSNEYLYFCEQSTDGINWTAPVTISPTARSATVTGTFAPSTEYWFRIRGFISGPPAAYYSAYATTSVVTKAYPVAPASLTATVASESQIDLSWADTSNETGFRLERSTTGAAGSWSALASVGADVTSYSHTGLAEATKYFYRVVALNAAGESSASSTANATTVLKRPTGLTASITSPTQASLSWTDNSSAETYYYLYQSTDGGATWVPCSPNRVNAGVTSATITGPFSHANTYRFLVRAYSTAAGYTWPATADGTLWVQIPTAMTLSPASVTVLTGATQQFTAQVTDQFGQPIALNNGDILWSITGTGTLMPDGVYTATYTASDSCGDVQIQATYAGMTSAPATVTVRSMPYIIGTPTADWLSASNNTQVTLSATGDSDDPNVSLADLRYTWAWASGPVGASFSPNGDNAAQNAMATLSKAGTYKFKVKVSDGSLESDWVETAEVTVEQVASSVVVSPTSASVLIGETQLFSAVVRDQFLQTMQAQPSWSLSSADLGTVSSGGLFAAGDHAASGTLTCSATGGTNPSATVPVSVVTSAPLDLTENWVHVTAESGYMLTLSSSSVSATMTGAAQQCIHGCTHLGPISSGDITIRFDTPVVLDSFKVTGIADNAYSGSAVLHFVDGSTQTVEISPANTTYTIPCGNGTAHQFSESVALPAGAKITKVDLHSHASGNHSPWCHDWYYGGIGRVTFSDFRISALSLDALTVTDDANAANTQTVSNSTAKDLYLGQPDTGDAKIDLSAGFDPSNSGNLVHWEIKRTADSVSMGSGTFADVTSITDKALTVTDTARAFEVKAWLDANNNGTLDPGEPTRTINVHVMKVDLDVDSDNGNGLSLPDGSDDEEAAEERGAGKVVVVNRDLGPNYTPRFADLSDTGQRFVPVVLQLPDNLPDSARIVFHYDVCTVSTSPVAIPKSGLDEVAYDTTEYATDGGLLRLWLHDGDAARTETDLLVPGEHYTPADIGAAGSGTVTLYVEAVNGSALHTDIRVELVLDETVVSFDTIRVLPLDPWLGIDETEVVGFNIVRNTSGSLALDGTPGNDIIVGNSHQGLLMINGLGGDDIIIAGHGENDINPGAGKDLILAAMGSNNIRGDSDDTVSYAGLSRIDGRRLSNQNTTQPLFAASASQNALGSSTPEAAAAASATRDQKFTSGDIIAAYKWAFGADDMWLDAFLTTNGKVLPVEGDGNPFTYWDVDWVQKETFGAWVGTVVKIQYNIGTPLDAALALRKAITDKIAYWQPEGWSDYFYDIFASPRVDPQTFSTALLNYEETRVRQVQYVAQVAEVAAGLYFNGMTMAAGPGADIIDAIISFPETVTSIGQLAVKAFELVRTLPGSLAGWLTEEPVTAGPLMDQPLGSLSLAMRGDLPAWEASGGFAATAVTPSAVARAVLHLREYGLFAAVGDVIRPVLNAGSTVMPVGFVLRRDMFDGTDLLKVVPHTSPSGVTAMLVGTAQVTNGADGAAHAAKCLELAKGIIDTAPEAKQVLYVGLNRSLRTLMDTGTNANRTFSRGMAKYRPDVFVVYWDTNLSRLKVELHEVLSAGNDRATVEANMLSMMQQIGQANSDWVTNVMQTYLLGTTSSLLVGGQAVVLLHVATFDLASDDLLMD